MGKAVELVFPAAGGTAGLKRFATFFVKAAATGFNPIATLFLAISAGVEIFQGKPPGTEMQLARKDPYAPRISGFGRARLAGNYVLFEAKDGKTYDVYAVHDGLIDGIEQYWLFDDEVTIDGSDWVDEVEGGLYRDQRVKFLTRLGLATETAYSEFVTDLPGIWTTDHRGDGVMSIALRCTQASEKKQPERYAKGKPEPGITGRLQLVYDPRDASTAWSDNPVLALMAYLTTAAGGMGLDYARRFSATESVWEAAADVCEEQIDLAAGGTEDRYSLGGVYEHTTQPADVIGSLLASFDGWLGAQGDGSLIVKAGKYEPPTVTFIDKHVLSYSIEHYRADEDACNELTIAFTDPASKYNTNDAGAWRDEAEIAALGKVRSQHLALPWVQSGSQARRLAKRKMAQLTAPLRGKVTTTLYGLRGLGERYIRLQIRENALLANLVVEVTDLEIDIAEMQLTYSWVQAIGAAIDDWTTAEETPGSEINPRPTPTPLDPPEITSLTGFYETGPYGLTQPRLRVVLETDYTTDELDWDVEWQVDGAGSWTAIPPIDEQTSPATIESGFVTADATVNVRGRYRTTTRTSDWSDIASIYLPAANPNAILDQNNAPILDEYGDQILDEYA